MSVKKKVATVERAPSLYSKRRRVTLPRPPKHVVISKKDVGQRLRALRLAREMTQAKLAKLIGAHATNISSIEHGTRSLTIQQLVKIAKALKVSTDAILGQDKKALPAPEAIHIGNGRLLGRLRRIAQLPRAKQKAVADFLDAYLEKHGQAHART